MVYRYIPALVGRIKTSAVNAAVDKQTAAGAVNTSYPSTQFFTSIKFGPLRHLRIP
jgi:hypothetical protein